jgi:CHAD domain-containing protein
MKAELTREASRDSWLSPIYETLLNKNKEEYGSFLNMREEDYLELLDWTGKQQRPDKSGSIPAELQPLLERMAIDMEAWLETVKKFDTWFHRVAGRLENVTEAAKRHGKKWLAGKTGAKTAFR